MLDVYYTKDSMEITEKETAKRLVEFDVNKAVIESNNGGRGFARSVKRIMQDELFSNHTVVRWFHQSKNKKARILSNSTWVMEHIYYPINWRDRWPEYYEAMTSYQKKKVKISMMTHRMRQQELQSVQVRKNLEYQY
ncbi:MAG: phage terminase large subunit [Monoglobus pectinilyticus]